MQIKKLHDTTCSFFILLYIHFYQFLKITARIAEARYLELSAQLAFLLGKPVGEEALSCNDELQSVEEDALITLGFVVRIDFLQMLVKALGEIF